MPQPRPALFQYFYVSQLAGDAAAATVPVILAQVRQGNAERGITGVLVFDGQSFVQYLEGPTVALQALVDRIAADPRHTQLQVLHQGELSQRRCLRYELGYADPTEEGALTQMLEKLHDEELKGEDALLRVLALRSHFDIEG